MNKRMNPAKPALPSGMVAIEKGPMREVVVGLLSGNRIPAFGFDVDGYAPNHYRMMPYGQFGLLLGSKHALEVRVLLDGKLLLEKSLYPSGPPSGPGMDAEIRSMMSERPQPFYLMEDNSGKPMCFTAHDSNLSPANIVNEQLHPDGGSSPPSMSKLDGGAAPTQELKSDITPLDLPDYLKQMLIAPPPSDAGPNAPSTAVLANTSAANVAPEGTADSASVVEADATGSGITTEASSTSEPLAPVMDTATRSVNWAPSHGLVAVGVRMIQQVQDNEPVRGPDAFTYVLFQLNPWNLHTLALSKLMGRVIQPSVEKMKKLMEEEGFGADVPQLPQVVCGSNCNHRNHRR